MSSKNILKHLQWDSDFFGKKIAKIEVSDILMLASTINAEIRTSSFDLVYLFVSSQESAIAEIEQLVDSASWVDGKVTYVKEIRKQKLTNPECLYSIVEMEDTLDELAIQAGVYSRFHTDRNFEPEQYVELYKKWIEKSVNKTIACEVIGFKEGKNLLGMITIGKKEDRADIGLVSVDEKARGKGIASQLLASAENFAFQNGFKEIQVVTQKQNEPACRLYEKYGFRLESQVEIFHIWK